MKTFPPKKAPASRSGGRISNHQAAVFRSSCKTWQSSSEITGFLYLFYYSPQGMSHDSRVTLRRKSIFANASGFKGFKRFKGFRGWWYRPSGDEYYSRREGAVVCHLSSIIFLSPQKKTSLKGKSFYCAYQAFAFFAFTTWGSFLWL